jgi:hypothetical protein
MRIESFNRLAGHANKVSRTSQYHQLGRVQQNSEELFRVENALNHAAVGAVLVVFLGVGLVVWGGPEVAVEPL